jgi:hypothetical protein
MTPLTRVSLTCPFTFVYPMDKVEVELALYQLAFTISIAFTKSLRYSNTFANFGEGIVRTET